MDRRIRDIIVIGASAGGVEAASALVQGLPSNLPASLFVAIHFPPDASSMLPQILSRAGPLPVAHAVQGEKIERGRIYVAPPDHHLTLNADTVVLTRGAPEHGNRPAVDPMFRSAALAFGARVIGVVLTGNLDDGTSGLLAIKRRGGLAVVQDPRDAAYPSMPRSAIQYVDVDRVAPIAEIAGILAQLVAERVETQESATRAG